MEIKIFTTDDAGAAEAMRVDMEQTGFTVVVCDKAEIVSIDCESLTNGCNALGRDNWVVIGKEQQ